MSLTIKVVFDTNILFTGSEAELVNQDTKTLIGAYSGISDIKIEWLIPSIVVDERRFQMYKKALELLPQIRRMERLLGHNLNITEEIAKQRVDAAITKQLESLGLATIVCDNNKVVWKEIISRACFRLPPFEDNDREKGFRDAIIGQSFMQLVEKAPSTPSVCRLVLLSSDAKLGEYVSDKLVDAANVKIFKNIEELKGLLDTLVSAVKEELIDAIKPKCNALFFVPNVEDCMFVKHKIRDSIESKFAVELAQIPESSTSRENGTWYISSSRFSSKKGQRITWKSRIEVVSRGLKEESTSYLQDLAYPQSSSVNSGLSALYSLAQGYANSNKKKIIVQSGRTVFDITWSVQLTTNNKLRLPRIDSIEFIEIDWKNPIQEPK